MNEREPSNEWIDAQITDMLALREYPSTAPGSVSYWLSPGEIRELIQRAVLASAPAATQAQAGFSQFLSDVMTAAGLVEHGRQCKALAERLADGCERFRPKMPTRTLGQAQPAEMVSEPSAEIKAARLSGFNTALVPNGRASMQADSYEQIAGGWKP